MFAIAFNAHSHNEKSVVNATMLGAIVRKGTIYRKVDKNDKVKERK